jgi:hypothetical protein
MLLMEALCTGESEQAPLCSVICYLYMQHVSVTGALSPQKETEN